MDFDFKACPRLCGLFDHPKNIVVGLGRVLWGEHAISTTGESHQAGWVLPGGQRTQDEQHAYLAAAVLDQLSRGA